MKTVLIVDDDPEYRRFMSELLQPQGWNVLEAGEGSQAVKIAKANRPEVVLCDLLMPRANGLQFCRSLRRDESLRQTKIIITSGRHFESDRKAALAAGADEYLTKPIEADQLLLLLARILDKAEPAEIAPAKPVSLSSATTRVSFWGVRGSIPTPGPSTVQYGGNTSCVEIRADGQIIILDAGTGLRLLGRELAAEFEDRPLDMTLLLTHTHWDHIQGLPFFLPVYKPQNHLHILGYEGARHGLENVLSSQMESPFFPIGLREVPANIRIEELKEMSFNVGSVRVQACFVNHPGICVGYRLFSSEGSIAFFPDNELRSARESAPQAPNATEANALEFLRSENQKMIDFLLGTDVLIMDTQYDREEYEHHVGWGHGCLDDVVMLALDAGVRQLFLFHHDPDHDDAKISQMVFHARELVVSRNGTLEIEAAREGARVELRVKA